MRFEVPQFIEIEDKIIGPLTWKQFVYVAGGVGILIILIFSPLPRIIAILIGFPLAVLSAGLAFHKVNNRPFSIFLESFVSYMGKGKLYLWRKSAVQSVVEDIAPTEVSTPSLSFTNKRAISALSRKLDLPTTPDHG